MGKKTSKVQEAVSRISERITVDLSDKQKVLAAGAVGVAALTAAGLIAVQRWRSGKSGLLALHVLPGGDGWVVHDEEKDDVLESFRRKRDAVRAGRARAGDHRPSCLVIHRADGTIARTHTYAAPEA